MSIPAFLFDINSPDRRGALRAYNDSGRSSPEAMVRGDGGDLHIRLCQRTSAVGVLRDISLAGAALKLAIGNPDGAPTDGTFTLTYSATTTSALAFGATAATVEAALNALGTITADGGVDVNGEGGLFSVRWRSVGARVPITADAGLLHPICYDTVTTLREGDGSTRELQQVRLTQQPLALCTAWTSPAAAGASIVEIIAGAAGVQEVQRLTLSPTPEGGAVALSFGQTQQVTVQCVLTTGSVNEVTFIYLTADAPSNPPGTYFDLSEDVGNPVRVWLDDGIVADPATPYGGRLLAVDVSGGWTTAAQLMALIRPAVNADAAFVTTNYGSQGVSIASATEGTRDAPLVRTLTAANFDRAAVGAYGSLANKAFKLADTAGTVGVWLNYGNGVNPPTLASGCTRTIEVDASATVDEATLATAIAAALDADAQFVSTATGAVVTATNAFSGPVTAPSAGDTGFSVAILRAGLLLSGAFDFDAKASDVDLIFGEVATCAKSAPSEWVFTFLEPGARSPFTADVSRLIVPGGLIGSLDLNTAQTALLLTGADFEAVIEGEVTMAGGKPFTFYRAPVTISRDLITAGASAPAAIAPMGGWLVNGAALGVTGLAGGGGANLDGLATTYLSSALYSVNDATHGWGIWQLVAGTTAENVPGGVLRPDDYATTTNEKVWLRRL